MALCANLALYAFSPLLCPLYDILLGQTVEVTMSWRYLRRDMNAPFPAMKCFEICAASNDCVAAVVEEFGSSCTTFLDIYDMTALLGAEAIVRRGYLSADLTYAGGKENTTPSTPVNSSASSTYATITSTSFWTTNSTSLWSTINADGWTYFSWVMSYTYFWATNTTIYLVPSHTTTTPARDGSTAASLTPKSSGSTVE